jgi:hypothetical protein
MADLDKIAKDFEDQFEVKVMTYPKDNIEISLHKDDRDEILVKSDTLIAFLSGFRAVVSQKMSKPFTKNDLELRRRIWDIYPHDRVTPFLWLFKSEPKFEVEE